MAWLVSRPWAQLNLVARLSLVVALSIILVAAGAAYETARHSARQAQAELVAEYNEQMDTLESVVLSALFADRKTGRDFDLERLIGLISDFKYGSNVTQISFRDTSDAAAFSQEIAIQLEAPLFFSRWCGLEIINVNRPIIVDGLYFGLLSLSLSPNRIINLAWKQYHYLLQVMFISLALVLFCIWFMLRKALHPLLSLAEASKTLTRGDLSVRVKVDGSPELRTVLLNFNQMASSFQATLAALRASETINRTILESLSQKIFMKDRNSVYISVNKSYADAYGLKAEDFVGKDDFAFNPAELARKYRGDDREVMEFGQMKDIEEAYVASGTDRVAHTIKVPIRNEAGEVTGLLGSFEDITERKQSEKEKEKLQAQLNQAQKMESIGVLAGGIAHDFNNILGAIMGYAEMARDEAPPGSQLVEDIDKVLTAAHRAKDLVKQILAFSRQSAVDRIPLKIQPLVKESLKMLRASIPSTISITEDIHPQSGTVLADPTQIHQIVMNLCTNAYHAMEKTGGQLAITVSPATVSSSTSLEAAELTPGDYVELTVSDTGTGIGADILDKIFEPYFTTKGVGKGSGMGLSITHGIIKSYGGAITVESTLGQGTTFHVYIPVIQEDSTEAEETTEVPRGRGRILFVDDEEMLLKIGHSMLERLGYTVTSRHGSFEALNTFMNDPLSFDLVITDQTMPGMTGTDLARRMMQIRPDVPIILCTGYSNLIDEESAKALGIREFAFKPLTWSSIGQLIRKVLTGETVA